MRERESRSQTFQLQTRTTEIEAGPLESRLGQLQSRPGQQKCGAGRRNPEGDNRDANRAEPDADLAGALAMLTSGEASRPDYLPTLSGSASSRHRRIPALTAETRDLTGEMLSLYGETRTLSKERPDLVRHDSDPSSRIRGRSPWTGVGSVQERALSSPNAPRAAEMWDLTMWMRSPTPKITTRASPMRSGMHGSGMGTGRIRAGAGRTLTRVIRITLGSIQTG